MDGLNLNIDKNVEDFPFQLQKKLIKQEFERILETISGVKEIVVDGTLMRSLDSLVSLSCLKAHDCLRIQPLNLNDTIKWATTTEHGVILARLTIPISEKICELIHASHQQQLHQISIICVDGRKNFFEMKLEQNGLFGSVDLFEFSFSFIQIETDLFSLELPLTYGRTYQQNEFLLAAALANMQSLYGPFCSIYGYGDDAFKVDQKMTEAVIETADHDANNSNHLFDILLLFDRFLDVYSALLTGFTYESILNDVFPYSGGKIIFDEGQNSNQTGKSTMSTPTRAFSLNNNDLIFAEIRDAHMIAVFPYLKSRAKIIASSIEKVKTALAVNKVEDMKSFVSNDLKEMRKQQQLLELHIGACEEVLRREAFQGCNERWSIECAIIRGEFEDPSNLLEYLSGLIKSGGGYFGPWAILQLSSLWSKRNGGIPSKQYDMFIDLFFKKFGIDFISAIFYLRKHMILFPQGGQKYFSISLPSFPFLHSMKDSRKPFEQNQTRRESTAFQNVNVTPIPPTQIKRTNSLLKSQVDYQALFDALKLCPPNSQKMDQSAYSTLNSTSSISLNGRDQIQESYVFSDAYIPMVCRLLEITLNDEFQSRRKNMSPHLDDNTNTNNMMSWDKLRQLFLSNIDGQTLFRRFAHLGPSCLNSKTKIVLVAFVGGVTYSEIAALRTLARSRNFRLLICTTTILHREQFLKSFAEP